MGILSFMRTRRGKGSGRSNVARAGATKVAGLEVADWHWAQALSITEATLFRRGARAELSFLDDRTLARQLLDRKYRAWLAGQVLLPSRRGIVGLVALVSGSGTAADFSPETFVPALLTYVERPLRVLIASGGKDDQLRDRLQSHAPWHEVIADPGLLQDGQAVDLVVVTKPRLEMSDRIRLSAIPASLVIFAGPRLTRLAEPEQVGGSRTAPATVPAAKSKAA